MLFMNENKKEFSNKSKKSIKRAEEDVKTGRVYSHEHVKKELEL